jgi:hypothetical protein
MFHHVFQEKTAMFQRLIHHCSLFIHVHHVFTICSPCVHHFSPRFSSLDLPPSHISTTLEDPARKIVVASGALTSREMRRIAEVCGEGLVFLLVRFT